MNIKYKRAYLTSCQLIEAPGKYDLVVSNDVTEANLVSNEDGTAPRYIVGFKAIAADKLPQVREVFKENEEVDIEQTNGLFMTGNIWKTGKEVLPAKGETVSCIIDFVQPRVEEGQPEAEPVLRVTSMKVHKSRAAQKLDLNKLFEATETTPASSTLQHS